MLNADKKTFVPVYSLSALLSWSLNFSLANWRHDKEQPGFRCILRQVSNKLKVVSCSRIRLLTSLFGTVSDLIVADCPLNTSQRRFVYLQSTVWQTKYNQGRFVPLLVRSVDINCGDDGLLTAGMPNMLSILQLRQLLASIGYWWQMSAEDCSRSVDWSDTLDYQVTLWLFVRNRDVHGNTHKISSALSTFLGSPAPMEYRCRHSAQPIALREWECMVA